MTPIGPGVTKLANESQYVHLVPWFLLVIAGVSLMFVFLYFFSFWRRRRLDSQFRVHHPPKKSVATRRSKGTRSLGNK